MKKVLIIGITGTHASGKDTVSDYICKKYNIKSYSTSDEIRQENALRGLDNSRLNMFTVGNELREKFGTGELAKRVLRRAKETMAVSSGIRNIGEIEYFKDHSYFYLIAVDAPIEMRYERAMNRDRVGDGRTLEDFRAGEEKEMNAGIAGQQLLPCMRVADYFILNDATKEHLRERTDEVLSAITNRFNEDVSK